MLGQVVFKMWSAGLLGLRKAWPVGERDHFCPPVWNSC